MVFFTPAGSLPEKTDINLNSDTTKESIVTLEVLPLTAVPRDCLGGKTSTSLSKAAVKICNKVKNRAAGASFTFDWQSAGPGGFDGSVGVPPVSGAAGLAWYWETSMVPQLFSGTTCLDDICFSQRCSFACPSFGPFRAPGRSYSASNITLTKAGLTADLEASFSPPTVLVSATSLVEQTTSGWFRYRTRIMNLTDVPMLFDLASAPPCTACTFVGVTVPPGGVKEYCLVDPHPAKEVSNQLSLCGPSIPDGPEGDGTLAYPDATPVPSVRCSNGASATRGMFEVLAPDPSTNIVTAPFLAPFDIVVTDPGPGGNGNAILEPGETASLLVSLTNAGPVRLNGVTATLASLPIDLTLDGTNNPIAVNISAPNSTYPDIVGTVPSSSPPGDCSTPPVGVVPSANVSGFVVSVPANHPGGVARPFTLAVSGTPAGGAAGSFQMVVHLVVVIGNPCHPP